MNAEMNGVGIVKGNRGVDPGMNHRNGSRIGRGDFLKGRLGGGAARARALPRKVDLLTGEDFQCALLGSLGFSTECIMSNTALSKGQVYYRLRIGGIKRKDYRNGASRIARKMMAQTSATATPILIEQLRDIVSKMSA